MQKIILFTFILVLTINYSCKKNQTCNGQDVFLGDVTLTNPFQVDSFAQFRYKEIDGELKIKSNIDLDLSALCSLNKVDRLIIYSRDIVSLNGLENIVKIDELSLLSCINLTNLNEFKNLKKLNSLYISNCTNIETISSFKNIISLNNISLNNNDKLEDIEGFSNLKIINNSFVILGNNSIENLVGFQNLESVEENFEIIENHNLKSLNGLSSLINANNNAPLFECNNIKIIGNTKLKDFCALQNLVKLDCSNTNGYYFVNNGYNPSRDDIESGNCSI